MTPIELRNYLDSLIPSTIQNLSFQQLKEIAYYIIGTVELNIRNYTSDYIDAYFLKNNLLLNELLIEYQIPNEIITEQPITDDDKIKAIRMMQRIKNVRNLNDFELFFKDIFNIEFVILPYQNTFYYGARPIMRPIAKPITSIDRRVWVINIQITSNPDSINLDKLKNVFIQLMYPFLRINVFE